MTLDEKLARLDEFISGVIPILTMGNSFRVDLYRQVTTPVEMSNDGFVVWEGNIKTGHWVILKEYSDKK